MPSGRLVFAMMPVDLLAASMRAPLALCGWLTPTMRGKKIDQRRKVLVAGTIEEELDED